MARNRGFMVSRSIFEVCMVLKSPLRRLEALLTAVLFRMWIIEGSQTTLACGRIDALLPVVAIRCEKERATQPRPPPHYFELLDLVDFRIYMKSS